MCGRRAEEGSVELAVWVVGGCAAVGVAVVFEVPVSPSVIQMCQCCSTRAAHWFPRGPPFQPQIEAQGGLERDDEGEKVGVRDKVHDRFDNASNDKGGPVFLEVDFVEGGRALIAWTTRQPSLDDQELEVKLPAHTHRHTAGGCPDQTLVQNRLRFPSRRCG